MKNCFRILAVLFALFVAIAGFNTNAMAGQNSTDTNQVAANSDYGYLFITIQDGEAYITYDDGDWGTRHIAIYNQSILLKARAGSSFEILGMPGFYVQSITADSWTVVAGQTTNVYVVMGS